MVNGFHSGSVTNGILATNDFTLLRNGPYRLEMTVRGGYQEVVTNVTFALDTELKVGQFSFSAGEQFDPELGLYFNRARYLKSDTGRFWTMDSYEGSQTDPLSLHKYLYAQGDPANRIDPSGLFTLVEQEVVSGIQTTLQTLRSQAPGAALKLARQRIFSMYLAFSWRTLNPKDLKPWFERRGFGGVLDAIQWHAGVYAYNNVWKVGVMHEVTIDVNAIRGGGMSGGNWGISSGQVQARSMPLNTFESEFRIRIPVAKLSSLQFGAWRASLGIVASFDDYFATEITKLLPVEYSYLGGFIGTGMNCTTWVLGAAGSAFGIGLTPN